MLKRTKPSIPSWTSPGGVSCWKIRSSQGESLLHQLRGLRQSRARVKVNKLPHYLYPSIKAENLLSLALAVGRLDLNKEKLKPVNPLPSLRPNLSAKVILLHVGTLAVGRAGSKLKKFPPRHLLNPRLKPGNRLSLQRHLHAQKTRPAVPPPTACRDGSPARGGLRTANKVCL